MTFRTSERQHLDALRGLGCLLLVTYHVVGSDPSAGLELQAGLLRDASDLLRYVRMPLFTFLSGLVYALRPYDGDWPRFLSGKGRRLLIPLITVGTVFDLIRSATIGTHADSRPLYETLLWPHSHFWYLHALFVVFTATLLLEAMRLLSTPLRVAAVLVTAVALSAMEFDVSFFAVDRAFYLFPFFVAGLGLQRFGLRAALDWRPGLLAALGVTVVLVSMAFDRTAEFSRSSIPGQLLGLLSCLALLSFRIAPVGLAWIGRYSFTIFLFHIFFTSGSRIALSRAGIADIGVLFVCASVAGLLGPVLIDHLLGGTRLTGLLFLGKSPTAGTRFWLSDWLRTRANPNRS